MLFYRFINNRRENLLIAVLFSGIFVVLELFYSIPVILEALIFSLCVIFFMIALCSSGEMTDAQIREALETLSKAQVGVSIHATYFLERYREFKKRLAVINTIEYMENATTPVIVSSITSETNYFINGILKRTYGILLVLNNKKGLEPNDNRIQEYKDAIVSMIDKLDDIALELNELGSSKEQIELMNDKLNDMLESIRESNYLLG